MFRSYIDPEDPIGLWSPLEYIGQEDDYDGHYDIYEDDYVVVPEEDDDRGGWAEDDYEDNFRPCAECGANTDGSSYESWGYCSRSCAIREH